jgi:NAD(P)-dependent dehydrogenase (short-subunit alcohol dehydrogenase family)
MGRAIARRLAEAGATVVVADLLLENAKAVADSLPGAEAYELDVSDTAAVTALTSHAVSAHGRLDIWVNNAGIYPLKPLFQVSEGDWNRMIDVNLKSVYFATREAARQMIAGGHGGVVVNVSSIAAYRPAVRGWRTTPRRRPAW